MREQLRAIVSKYPGRRPVSVVLTETGDVLRSESGVRPCDDLYMALFDLMGGEEREDEIQNMYIASEIGI